MIIISRCQETRNGCQAPVNVHGYALYRECRPHTAEVESSNLSPPTTHDFSKLGHILLTFQGLSFDLNCRVKLWSGQPWSFYLRQGILIKNNAVLPTQNQIPFKRFARMPCGLLDQTLGELPGEITSREKAESSIPLGLIPELEVPLSIFNLNFR